nr:UDP-forming cellulose synthase catalytic subunit [Salinimonas lutimaris]
MGFNIFFVLCLLLLSAVLAAPMDSTGQLVASGIILLLIHLSGTESKHHHRYRLYFRVFALLLGLALTIRYILWRGMYTMSASDWISLVAMWLLYVAELYAAFTHVISCMVNINPLTRPEKTIRDLATEQLPSVDILIPTYNESADILDVTLRAAKQLNYPPEKLHVHLLDDGGTLQKRTQDDREGRQAAILRAGQLRQLCQSLGVTYLSRDKNEYAKAGNVNSALQHTQSELVVILDADHVPTADFLDKTVPWLATNPKVFLVQTPHFMANPDPVERNYFAAFTRMPSENDMFYGTIQQGLDFWNASFFCGSAAVLRRAHLDEVGGLSGKSVTEDAETAYDLHAMGYESVYVNRPMVSGLAPETLNAFISQRMRWAQGMTQILLLKKPQLAEGLSLMQRAGYLSSILFWLFPFARIIFLLMPLAYLVFGLQIYHASLTEILAYTLPHVIATYQLSTLLFGRTRWPLVSELYEILQCTFTLRALVRVFRNPEAPSFVVTPKGENLEKNFVSPLSGVFYCLITLLLLGVVIGFYKLVNEPLTRDLTVIVLLWNLFNLVLMFSVLSILIERKQVRVQARLPANDEFTLQSADGRAWVGTMSDLSLGGARARIHAKQQTLPETLSMISWCESKQKNVVIPCTLLHHEPQSGAVRFQFERNSFNSWDDIIAFTLGDSRRWKSFQRRRTRPISYWYGARHVLNVSIRPVFQHFIMQVTSLWQQLATNKDQENEN